MHRTVIRIFLIVTGWTAILLGTIGIFLPILPTTPFLLLAAFCFSKSSNRFHQWLLASKLFGPFITNWELHRGLTVRQKSVSIGMLWLTIGISVVFFVHILYAKIAMLTVAVSVSVFLLMMKTVAASHVDSYGRTNDDSIAASDATSPSHPNISGQAAYPSNQRHEPIDIRESA